MPLILEESKSRWETLQEMNCAEGSDADDSLGRTFCLSQNQAGAWLAPEGAFAVELPLFG